MFGLGQRGVIQTSQAGVLSNQLKGRPNSSTSIMRSVRDDVTGGGAVRRLRWF